MAGRAAAVDARLLEADFFARVAQIIHVIEVDAGDDRDVGIEHIHRIEPPAEADFEDGHVDAGSDELHHRAQRAEFEIGQRGVAAGRVDPLERSDQFGVARFPAGNAHAFVVAQQMGRGVETGPVAGGAEDGFQIGTGGALAVGAADHDQRESRGKPERILDAPHPLQSQFDRAGMQLFEPRQPVGQRDRN